MAIEVGALTLAIGVDRGTVIQQLRQIDSAVQRSADRGTKLNRLAANQYKSWWKDAIRQRETEERRVEAETKAANRRASAQYVSWWTQALNEVESVRASHETLTANEWNARRRQAREYTRLWRTLLSERDSAEAKSESYTSNYWMARRRHAKGYSNLWNQLLAEREAKEAAAERESANYHLAKMRRVRVLARAENLAYAEEARRNRPTVAPKPARPPKYPTMATPAFSTFGITGTLLGTAGLAKLVDTANEMQVVQQRLNQVSASGLESKLVFDQLAAASQRLRQPLGQMSELFAKLRQSNENVVLSVNETLKVTEAFTAALRLSGATGQTAASALLQFGQAMAKGNLDGDEFRTIAENNSEVLLVLQRQYGKTRAEILKMREEGQLTARMMADALIKEYDKLIDRSTKLAPTLGQGATAISNSLLIVMTNSTSTREAIEKLGRAMTDFADFFQTNGALIFGVGALGTGLWVIYRAVTAVQTALAAGTLMRFLNLLTNPAIAALLVVGAGGVGYMQGVQQASQEEKRKIEAMSTFTQKGIGMAQRENVKKQFSLLDQIAAQQKKIDQPQLGEWVSTAKKRKADLEEALKLARREYVMLHEAMKIRQAKDALDEAGKKVEAPAGGGGNAIKEAKDQTDEYINSLIRLLEAEMATEENFKSLNEQLAKQRDLLKSEDDVIKRAVIVDRIKRITDALRDFHFVNNMLGDANNRVAVMAENFELLVDGMTTEDVSRVIEYVKQLSQQMESLAVGTEAYVEAAKKLAAIQEALAKYVSPEKEKKAPKEQRTRTDELREQLLETLAQAPEEVFIGFFESLGRQWADGSQKLGEQMKQIFGGIMQQVGQNMIRLAFSMIDWKSIWNVMKAGYGMLIAKMGGATGVLGRFLTAIKGLLANPLVAGPALIAVGAAMVAYGAKMGAIGRGGGGDSLIGTIGGLNVGGTQKPLIYTFGNQQNPFQGAKSAAAAAGSVIVNATVIGPNDPAAQRQIAALVDNAARRGLMNGSGMRTG